MIRGLWSATGGMLSRELKQDVITNNLANAATSGYRRRTVAFRSTGEFFGAVLEQHMFAADVPSAKVSVPYAQDYQDIRPGAFQQTGNKMNAAIEGKGYFMVEDRGVISLTRSGSFAVNSDGELVTSMGEKVLGTRGVIRVPEEDWEIDRDGNIVAGGQVVDTISISGGSPDSPARIRQGELEMSNVNTVTEMVDLISNLRAYEANQRVVHSIDQTLDKLINEAGK